MIKKTAAFLLCTCVMLLAFAGCSDNKNSEIVGKWVPTTALINGETVQYNSLGLSETQFGLDFKSNGKCTATLAGITGEGTYTFNDTSVDVVINGDTQRFDYDSGVLTLSLNYGGETTSFSFTKSR